MPPSPIEDAVNDLTDKDACWWPFLWLRPPTHVPLSFARLLLLALLYGLPAGMLISLPAAIAQPEHRAGALVLMMSMPMLLLFVATVLIGPMWNRRAARLRVRSEAQPDLTSQLDQ